MPPKQLCAAFLLIFACALPASSQAGTHSAFALHDGDRVVFYGDSITAQRLYTRFAEDIVVTRYPSLRISFFNAGASGDTVDGGHSGDMETRIKRDVLPLRPTVVTIMLGMNDGRYTAEYDSNFKVYAAGYRKLIAQLQADIPGVRLFLIAPSPYDEVAHGPAIEGYDSVMVRYGQFVAALGKEKDIPVIDFNQPMTAAEQRGLEIDKALAGSLQPDRIHPSPAGHWILAVALAQGWDVDPLVSSLTIDAQFAKSGDAHNANVTSLAVSRQGISWTELEQALPLPLELNDATTQFLLQASDMAALDREILRVTGLTDATYTLLVDGKKIGLFSREELDAGVNLALFQTPMEEQAKSIDWTADDRAKLSGTRFALLSAKQPDPALEQALAALDRLDNRMIDEEYKSAQSNPHHFELVPGDKQP